MGGAGEIVVVAEQNRSPTFNFGIVSLRFIPKSKQTTSISITFFFELLSINMTCYTTLQP